MLPRRLRIIDLIAIVGLSACGASIVHDTNPSTRDDPTYIACPLIVSTAIALWLAATIAARFGPAPRRPFYWGFALCAGAYLTLGFPIGFDPRLQPVPTILVNEAMGALGHYAKDAGWTSVVQLAEFLCFLQERYLPS
jgi:hypothetical protein